MALSTDQVLEILVKITGYPVGLFKETDHKTRMSITAKTFFCDADIDEYNVLINGKDEIIEIKNSDFTWSQALILDLLSPKNQAPPPVQQTPLAQSPLSVNPPVNHLPQLSGALNFSTLLDPSSLAILAQAAADYVKLNPNCILDLFGSGASVNEASAHIPSAWEFSFIEGGREHVSLTFNASNASDQSIAEQVTASIGIDLVSGQVEFISIEG